MELPHSIAIVTGASRSRGIGAATCRALAQQGIDIFFTYWQAYDRSQYGDVNEDIEGRMASLRAFGVRCASLEIDQGRPEAAGIIFDQVERHMGIPTILVNNAAYSTRDGYAALTADMIDAHYQVNMRGTMLLSVELARRVAGKGGGRIINLVSGQDGPMPTELAYVATKGAIAAFTISLAAELAPLKILVNAVDPGPTDTGWISAEPETQRYLLEHAPLGRVGQPEDAARLIAFLASDAAGWITGQIIHSRGGF